MCALRREGVLKKDEARERKHIYLPRNFFNTMHKQAFWEFRLHTGQNWTAMRGLGNIGLYSLYWGRKSLTCNCWEMEFLYDGWLMSLLKGGISCISQVGCPLGTEHHSLRRINLEFLLSLSLFNCSRKMPPNKIFQCNTFPWPSPKYYLFIFQFHWLNRNYATWHDFEVPHSPFYMTQCT